MHSLATGAVNKLQNPAVNNVTLAKGCMHSWI